MAIIATQKCITEEARARYASECRRAVGLLTASGQKACANARLRLCPAPDVAPTIEENGSGINLLGPWEYRGCEVTPPLAPYPPSRPLPNEAQAQAALERLTAQATQQSSEVRKLQSRAQKARKIELSPGFWLGLGLVGLGGAALYFRR